MINGEEPVKEKVSAGRGNLLIWVGVSRGEPCSSAVWTGSLAGSVVWWGGDGCHSSKPGVVCCVDSCGGGDGS